LETKYRYCHILDTYGNRRYGQLEIHCLNTKKRTTQIIVR